MTPTAEQSKIRLGGRQLIEGEKLAVMATVRRDGGPQLTPIYYAYADGRFLISTTRNRAKYKNVRRNPQVSLCIVRPEGRPYLTVTGRAEIEESEIEQGTAEIFRRMSDRPLPENFADGLRRQGRILIIVTPDHYSP